MIQPQKFSLPSNTGTIAPEGLGGPVEVHVRFALSAKPPSFRQRWRSAWWHWWHLLRGLEVALFVKTRRAPSRQFRAEQEGRT